MRGAAGSGNAGPQGQRGLDYQEVLRRMSSMEDEVSSMCRRAGYLTRVKQTHLRNATNSSHQAWLKQSMRCLEGVEARASGPGAGRDCSSSEDDGDDEGFCSSSSSSSRDSEAGPTATAQGPHREGLQERSPRLRPGVIRATNEAATAATAGATAAGSGGGGGSSYATSAARPSARSTRRATFSAAVVPPQPTSESTRGGAWPRPAAADVRPLIELRAFSPERCQGGAGAPVEELRSPGRNGGATKASDSLCNSAGRGVRNRNPGSMPELYCADCELTLSTGRRADLGRRYLGYLRASALETAVTRRQCLQQTQSTEKALQMLGAAKEEMQRLEGRVRELEAERDRLGAEAEAARELRAQVTRRHAAMNWPCTSPPRLARQRLRRPEGAAEGPMDMEMGMLIALDECREAAEMEVERMRIELEDAERCSVKLDGSRRAKEEELREVAAKARLDCSHYSSELEKVREERNQLDATVETSAKEAQRCQSELCKLAEAAAAAEKALRVSVQERHELSDKYQAALLERDTAQRLLKEANAEAAAAPESRLVRQIRMGCALPVDLQGKAPQGEARCASRRSSRDGGARGGDDDADRPSAPEKGRAPGDDDLPGEDDDEEEEEEAQEDPNKRNREVEDDEGGGGSCPGHSDSASGTAGRRAVARGQEELGEDGEKGPHAAPSLPLKHRLPLRPPQHPGIRATGKGSKKAVPGASGSSEAALGRRARSRAASGQVVGGGKGSFPDSQAALETTEGAGRSSSGAGGQGPRVPSRPAGPRHPPPESLPEHPGLVIRLVAEEEEDGTNGGDLEPQGDGALGPAVVGSSLTPSSVMMPPQPGGGPGQDQTLPMPLPSASDLFQSSRWQVSLRHPSRPVPRRDPSPAERFSAALEELQMGQPGKDPPVESFAEMLARLNADYPDSGPKEGPKSKPSEPQGVREASQ